MYPSSPLPPPHLQIIFWWGLKHYFFISCSQGLKKFQISCGASELGGPYFLLGREGGGCIFSHKAINNQSWKIKNSWWQINLFHIGMTVEELMLILIIFIYNIVFHIILMCMLTFLVYLRIFCFRVFCLFKCPFKLSK